MKTRLTAAAARQRTRWKPSRKNSSAHGKNASDITHDMPAFEAPAAQSAPLDADLERRLRELGYLQSE